MAVNMMQPKLTKSNFTAGLQCEKRLYLEKYRKELRVITPADQLRFDEGNEVGRLAQKLFPQGTLVNVPAWDQDAAEKRTRELIASGRNTLFEAAFGAGRLAVRVDVLHRNSNPNIVQASLFDEPEYGWEIIEVKSGTSPRDGSDPKREYLIDVAFQVYVMRKAGENVGKASLILLNHDFEHRGVEPTPNELFEKVDVTALVEQLIPTIEADVERMLAVLDANSEPAIEIGPQCDDPYHCPFHDYCHPEPLPIEHLMNLPRIDLQQYRMLRSAGISRIQDIPDEMLKHSTQERVREALRSGARWVDPAIHEELDSIAYPIHFVDFETAQYAIPKHVGTGPYDFLPVQWSDHVLDANGNLSHDEFIYAGFGDPRPDFISSLTKAIEGAASIVVYSNFEEQRLKDLMKYDESMAKPLYEAFSDRVVDLLKLIRAYIYYPEFCGSFSIKRVLPAMVPSLSYDGLNIQEGEMATTMYRKMIDPKCPPNEREQIKKDLLEYCKLDTLAMVELFKELQRLIIDNR
jgi:predicted RecB family nuclease